MVDTVWVIEQKRSRSSFACFRSNEGSDTREVMKVPSSVMNNECTASDCHTVVQASETRNLKLDVRQIMRSVIVSDTAVRQDISHSLLCLLLTNTQLPVFSSSPAQSSSASYDGVFFPHPLVCCFPPRFIEYLLLSRLSTGPLVSRPVWKMAGWHLLNVIPSSWALS